MAAPPKNLAVFIDGTTNNGELWPALTVRGGAVGAEVTLCQAFDPT